MAPRPLAGRGEIWARLWQTKPPGQWETQGRICREHETAGKTRRGRCAAGAAGVASAFGCRDAAGCAASHRRKDRSSGPDSSELSLAREHPRRVPEAGGRQTAGGASCASGAQASPPPTRPEPHGRYERREAFPLRAENTKELGSTNIIPGENDPTRTTNGKRGVMC